MRKKIVLLCLYALIAVMARANTISVSTLNELKNALKETGATAQSGDTVKVTNDITVGECIDVYQSVTITADSGKKITFQGGEGISALFAMQADVTVYFEGLTIVDGRTNRLSTNTPAIEVGRGTVIINNCNFQNWSNTDSSAHGVICIKGTGVLSSITSTTFSNCAVDSGKGIIFVGNGKSIPDFYGDIAFTNCTGSDLYKESDTTQLYLAIEVIPTSGVKRSYTSEGTSLKTAAANAADGSTINVIRNYTSTERVDFSNSQTYTITAATGVTITNGTPAYILFCNPTDDTYPEVNLNGLTIDGGGATVQLIECKTGTDNIIGCTIQNVNSEALRIFASGTMNISGNTTISNCTHNGLIFVGNNNLALSGTLTFNSCKTDYEIYSENHSFTERNLTVSNSAHSNKLRVAYQDMPDTITTTLVNSGTLATYELVKVTGENHFAATDTNNAWHLMQSGANVVFSSPIMVQNGNSKTFYGSTQLATAASNATTGSTIHIYEDCTESSHVNTDNKTLTFQGHNNAKVTKSVANGTVFFYNQNSGNATYNNLIIESEAENTSSAIEAQTGTATINNCTFNNWKNTAADCKGAICVNGNGAGTITINGATFSGCEVTSGRGLIFIGNKSNLTIDGAVSFTNCTGYEIFTENTAFIQGSSLAITKDGESGNITIALENAPSVDATTLVTNGTLAKYTLANLSSYTGWVVRQNGSDVEVGRAYIKVTNSGTDTYLDDLYEAVQTHALEGATVIVLKNYTQTRTINVSRSMTITAKSGVEVVRDNEFNYAVGVALGTADVTATIQNITINGNNVENTHAAIDCSNGKLILNNVTIKNWQNTDAYGNNQGIICCKGNGNITMTGCDLSTGNVVSNWAGLLFVGNNQLTLDTGNNIPSSDTHTEENPTNGTASIYIERGYYITTTAVPSNNLVLALAADYYEREVVMSEYDVTSKFSLSLDTQKRFANLQEVGNTHNLGVTGDNCVYNIELKRHYTDLASAINDAATGQTLNIVKSCKISSPADMGKVLTINNTKYDGTNYCVVELCASADYRINGKTSAIPFYGVDPDGSITFNNVIFDGNNEIHNSSFAEMAQGTLIFNNCTFRNWINNYGEGENEDDGNQGIVCCKNHHKDEQGHEVGGKLLINGCTFNNNKVYEGYGVIFIGNPGVAITGNTTFFGNSWRDSNGDDIAESVAYDVYLERSYINYQSWNISPTKLTWETPIRVFVAQIADGYVLLSCVNNLNRNIIASSSKFMIANEGTWYQYVPCGENTLTDTNEWKYSFHPTDVCITPPVSVSLAAEISSSGIPYTTFCAKYDTKVPAGLKAWRAISENGIIATFQALGADEVIPGYEGVVLTHASYNGPGTEESDNGEAFSGIMESNETAIDKYTLSQNICRGSVAPYPVDQSAYYYYTMSKGQTISRGRLTYTMYTGTTALPANKSFFRIARTDEDGKSNYGKFALSFSFEETTGIVNANANRNANDNTVYDLNGRKVTSPKKGIYIMNNKKYIIK